MPVMLSKTYEALIAAGAPEDKARAAAEELAGYEARICQNRDRSRCHQMDVGDCHRGRRIARDQDFCLTATSLLQRLDDLLAHLFGVAEQHHRVVAVEQFVLDPGIA